MPSTDSPLVRNASRRTDLPGGESRRAFLSGAGAPPVVGATESVFPALARPRGESHRALLSASGIGAVSGLARATRWLADEVGLTPTNIGKAALTACAVGCFFLLSVGLAPAAEAGRMPLPRPGAQALVAGATAPSIVPKDPARTAAAPLRIIDGDTFEIGGREIGGRGGEVVRIADIDTPEIRGKCDAEKSLARLAARRLGALLDEPGWVIARQRRRDRNGRTLALVLRPAQAPDGAITLVSLGGVLVAEGYAVTWAGRRHDWCGRDK